MNRSDKDQEDSAGLAVCVLASGSSGNSTYVAAGGTGILIDAGLSARELTRRLEGIGVAPESIQAVCLTHEHSDHTGGLRVLHRRYGWAIYANSGTVESLVRNPDHAGLTWKVFTTGFPFEIGALRLEPFTVSHDATDPVGFVIHHGEFRLGLVTDMGMATEVIRQRLSRCRALVLESNHDEHLLKNSGRPWPLIQRIQGRQGHLSNRHAAELIGAVAGETLEWVFLAHLSSECNRPDLALATVASHLKAQGLDRIGLEVCGPDRPSSLYFRGARK